MESLAITTQHASTTLENASQTLGDAQAVLRDTSDTLVALSDALDVSILGSRPFGGASERMANLARTVAAFEEKALTLGTNLHENGTDVTVMTDQIRALKTQVNELAARISGFDRIGELVGLLIGGIVLGALLTAWVAVAAAFCAWAGLRLRRVASVETAPPPA